MLQGQKTLGYALVDSPVGQCAWILEKFYAWTDCRTRPEDAISRDELLDNVMLYWLPATGASSARLYWESFVRPATDAVHVPTGWAPLSSRCCRARTPRSGRGS